MTPPLEESPFIRFSWRDMELFSAASGDRSPLHVSESYARATPYGEILVFGQLGVIACLGRVSLPAGCRIASLRIEFLRPMFLDVDYRISVADDGARLNCALFDGTSEVMRIGIETEGDSEPPATGCDLPHFAHATAFRRREADLVPGLEVSGRYNCDRAALETLEGRWNSPDRGWLHCVLCWSSYFTGMDMPGDSGLSAKVELSLPRQPLTGALLDYKASVRAVDRRTGQMTNEFTLTADGAEVASGVLRPFIRANDPAGDPETAVAGTSELTGQVALIVGGSRGLGAATKKALESRGATVYSLARFGAGDRSVSGTHATRLRSSTCASASWPGMGVSISWCATLSPCLCHCGWNGMRSNESSDI